MVETSGVFGLEVSEFLHELGVCHDSSIGGTQPLHVRDSEISVTMQRGNASAVLGTLAMDFALL